MNTELIATISRKQLKHLERKAAAAWYASHCAKGEGDDDSLYWRWQEIKGELERRRNEEKNAIVVADENKH